MRSTALSDRVGLWFAWVRVGAIPLAVVQVVVGYGDYPGRHGHAAWALTAVLAVGALSILALRVLARRRRSRALSVFEIAFDTAIIGAFALVFSFENGQPLWSLFFVPPLEAGLRFGFRAGIVATVPAILLLAGAEVFRAMHFDPEHFRVAPVFLRASLAATMGAIVGRLVDDLAASRRAAEARANEAEALRDELGRRVDVLEAANRCARALGSSLELDEAFTAFIRELQGLVPFDRVAIVLAEDGSARVMATAGAGEDDVFPPGTARPVVGSVLEEVLQGELVYRADLDPPVYPEERELLDLGLRCRLAAPVSLGARTVGMLSVVRRTPASFRPEEIELVSLLGRLVATAVQNIRSYEAERSTVDELRRLSALRADFVSLVSHELRSPMAAVIGSARTLQQRWRELGPEQRESFLELIAGETTRLATLIGDVLDTSRIEAGTFSYAFTTIDVAALVRDTVATAAIGIDEVELEASVAEPLPLVRGDRERLRQVLGNLIENAVKYSPAGEAVRVNAYRHGRDVVVDVTDTGPGISREHQRLIFEKFGRVASNGGKPGTGLGLFIARSIVEAHGGTLEVRSTPGRGATFSVTLPVPG
jgi:signal transduction histidine kinase